MASYLTNAPSGTILSGNTFYDNRVPLGINGTFSVDNSNAFDNSAVSPKNPQPNEYNGIIVNTGPDLDGSVTWGATTVPFIIDSSYVLVSNTGVLTLADGVIIKFGAGARIVVNGEITSKGTTKGIVFTSIKDDANGGDTNADGSATSPGSGDWFGVSLEGSTGSTFENTGFYYAGGNDLAALQIDTAASVTGCVFAHDRTSTASILSPGALNLPDATATMVVTGNLFYDDTVPLVISDAMSLDDSNSFDNSAADPATPQPSQYNGIVVNDGPNLEGAVRWTATKVPFAVVQSTYMVVDTTASLTLGNDVTLKFPIGTSSGIAIAQGGTFNVGTGDVFTSIRDDAHGGDTNGDGSATSPAAGDWWGISDAANGDSGLGTPAGAGTTCEGPATEYYDVCPG